MRVLNTLPELEEVKTTRLFDDTLLGFPEKPSLSKSVKDSWSETGWVYDVHLDAILTQAIQKKASDVHLLADQDVCFTVLGDIEKQTDIPIPTKDDMNELVKCLMTYVEKNQFNVAFEFDNSYTIQFGPYKDVRTRVNYGYSFGVEQLTFRVIQDTIPSKQSIQITKDIEDLFQNTSGVIFVAGPTGSGKSTTLASIIQDIQLHQAKKIITIENPVEYIYDTAKGKSLIVQRSIPTDCRSFGDGLTSAMRSAPNIIQIGEVRNRTEVDELLRASETGHLALTTIHTTNNITTLNRILSLYDGHEQGRVLNTLGDNLRGIINQTLVKTVDGTSRFAVREVLIIDFTMRKLIQDKEFQRIRSLQEERQETMEHKLIQAYQEGKCTLEEARKHAPDITYFDYLIKQG